MDHTFGNWFSSLSGTASLTTNGSVYHPNSTAVSITLTSLATTATN